MSTQYTLVIADDEEIERKALSLLFRKEFPQVAVAGLAQNGVELVSMVEQLNPDIAIVDVNMPGLNGIDAIDLLCARGVDTRFIINTAYSEFDYVQRALALKIDAYILKPEKRDATIATIRKLLAAIDERRAAAQSQRQIKELFWRIQPVMENEILYSIFMGQPAADNFAVYCEMHAATFEAGAMVSLVPQNPQDSTLDGSDKAALRATVAAALEGSCSYLATAGKNSVSLLLFVPAALAVGGWQAWLADVVRVLLNRLKNDHSLLLKAGVGGLYPAFARMHDSYGESLLALREPADRGISFYQSGGGGGEEGRVLLLADTLAAALREGREAGEWQAALAGGADILRHKGGNARALWQAVCLRLAADHGVPGMQETEAGSAGPKPGPAEPKQEPTALQRALAKRDERLAALEREVAAALERAPVGADYPALLEEGLLRLSRLYAEGPEEANPHVLRALSYIQDHYPEDISLDDLAGATGISSYYFSRLFKSETGQSFVEYLTALRIRKAAALARDTGLSIKEISERVGYTNASYFCRVFKKQTGQTIGELREAARRKEF